MKPGDFGAVCGVRFPNLTGDADWYDAPDGNGIVCEKCTLKFEGIDGSDKVLKVSQLRIKSFRSPVRVFAFHSGSVEHFDLPRIHAV